MVSTKRQYLTKNCLSELYIQAGFSKFSGFRKGVGQFQYITYLNLPLPPYSQGSNQEQEIQCILIQRLNMKLLGSQHDTN